jgi:uncharacterized protein (TIGR00266 family)
MALHYKIHGTELQALEIILNSGESVRAEPGMLVYMDAGVDMQTNMGGLWQGLKRAMGGASFFLTTFSHKGESGKSTLVVGASYPGKVIPISISPHEEILCQKDAFLCAEPGVNLEMAFTRKLGAGFFGGDGFILQRLQGHGQAFIHAGGTVLQRELESGEAICVDAGCVAAFSRSVDFDIQFVGGFKNALFGGEGLFFAKLRGPGTVYIQSLPFSRLADRIMAGRDIKSSK